MWKARFYFRQTSTVKWSVAQYPLPPAEKGAWIRERGVEPALAWCWNTIPVADLAIYWEGGGWNLQKEGSSVEIEGSGAILGIFLNLQPPLPLRFAPEYTPPKGIIYNSILVGLASGIPVSDM